MKFSEKMLAFIGCLIVGILLSCGSSIKQQTAQSEKTVAQANLEQIAEIGKATTVQIGSLSVEGPPALGSGFFITQDLIVTNIHVINQRSFDGAISVAKSVSKPTWYTIIGVMASDPKRDLVVLKVAKMGGEDPHVLSLGDSNTVKAGDNIVAIGSPLQGNKFVRGDVSKGTIRRRTPNFLDIRVRNIRKGYSGGPVLNIHGDVIGITFQAHRIGAGYAIPSNYLRALLKDIPTQPKSLEKWREDPLIRYYSAVDTAKRGETTNAIKDFDTVINLAPDFADAYINRGYARRELGNFEDAIRDYDTAIRLGADYAYVYFYRGIVKADSGDKRGAIKDYDRAIHLDSGYIEPYSRRASAKSDLGDNKGAIEDYNTVIRLKPDGDLLALAYVNRGVVKSDLVDEKGAIEDYNTVIRLKPDGDLLALAYVNRARAKSDLGDNEGAIEDSNTVMRLKPGDTILAAAYNIRGKAKSDQGDNTDSIVDYDKAIQLKPNHAEFYYNRGVANTALERTSEAEIDLKAARKLLEQAISISKSDDEEAISENLTVHLDVRSDLKADIEEALQNLE